MKKILIAFSFGFLTLGLMAQTTPTAPATKTPVKKATSTASAKASVKKAQGNNSAKAPIKKATGTSTAKTPVKATATPPPSRSEEDIALEKGTGETSIEACITSTKKMFAAFEAKSMRDENEDVKNEINIMLSSAKNANELGMLLKKSLEYIATTAYSEAWSKRSEPWSGEVDGVKDFKTYNKLLKELEAGFNRDAFNSDWQKEGKAKWGM